MVTLSELYDKLATINYKPHIFMRKEVKDLARVLSNDENIVHCINGHYAGGMALLVATDQRLLIVDHKPMFLTVDSISYSMIQEMFYNYRLLNSGLKIFTSTSSKTLDFISMNHYGMKAITDYAQSQISVLRSSLMNPNNMIASHNASSTQVIKTYKMQEADRY